MITSEKDWPRYNCKCHCGKQLCFMSNNPPCSTIDVICECYEISHLITPTDDSSKYRYRTQPKTELLRHEILCTFSEIEMEMTVRQVYYQLVVKNALEKTEAGYGQVQRQLLLMRREGLIPYFLISDSSRRKYQIQSHNGLEDAATDMIHHYRLNVWKDLDVYVEIWLEKEALSGIFTDVTYEFDVPLCVTKGFASDSFIFRSANYIKHVGKETFIYIFSDYDPSGLRIADDIGKKLKSFGVDPHIERIGLTKEQVDELGLPTRPTKKSTHQKGFIGESTELDAMHPLMLKELIQDCIYRHISQREIENIKMEEAVHKKDLANMFGLA